MTMFKAQKTGMSLVFNQSGDPIPVTVLRLLPNLDIQNKTTVDYTKLQEGQTIEIQAISKGKGFAGTIKRHHFSRGPKTHGSNNYRQPGSIGSAFPQRVVKGKKMAGHMGYRKTTVKGSSLIKVDLDKNIILVKGPVPGPNKSYAGIVVKSEEKNG